MRSFDRTAHQLRPVSFRAGIQKAPAGSVLVAFGDTQVICSVSIEERVPSFLRDSGEGWITAEYDMMAGSSSPRVKRAAKAGRISGRSQEISRLIGRSLRAAIDRKKLGPRSLLVDCDVLQADGGTRTAAITGSWVAISLAVRSLLESGKLAEDPIIEQIAAVSVGLGDDGALVDLDYSEDSTARADVNIVGSATGAFVEVQGTAEKGLIQPTELTEMLAAATTALSELCRLQELALEDC